MHYGSIPDHVILINQLFFFRFQVIPYSCTFKKRENISNVYLISFFTDTIVVFDKMMAIEIYLFSVRITL